MESFKNTGPGTSQSEEDELRTVLVFQRQEFMAAKTLDSDLDLAFHLQMQEAFNASLSCQCPSGSTSQNPSISTLPDRDEDDGEFDYLSLMLEDIDRVAVERRDHQESQEEMRRLKREIDRRIHDQKFANYIMNVPEAEWKKFGDNYESPFDENGGLEMQRESFKLYVNGLVSEERVSDARVMVAGAGVAICDFRDNVVLEMKKALEGANTLSREMAVLEALIHGLNAALSLDLRRVTFYCDDYMVYQYVTSKLLARQSRMATLVNEIASLQRKFVYCEPSLVARNDMKFAVKLARDAIISQITWPIETEKGKRLKETCVICFEGVDADRMFTVDGCFHRFCFYCMKQHVEVKLLNGMLAECPHGGCKSEITVDHCGVFLDARLVDVLNQRRKEASISVADKVYCPFPTCSALMSKHEVLEYTKKVFLGAEQSGARKCKKCKCFFCINCKVPWHYNMTCNDYKRLNPYPQPEDSMLNSLAKKKLWRPCVKCNHMIELAEGCYHITCRCGHEFCYTCGAEWKDKKATCSCKLWEERNIICQGQERR